MALLTDYTWATKYDSDALSLIKEFYEPALNCAIRYDRSTGFFSARILNLAARGIEGLSCKPCEMKPHYLENNSAATEDGLRSQSCAPILPSIA